MKAEEQIKITHITKKISESGLCSRREAKSLIFAGKVKVNGSVVQNSAIKVSDSDEIIVSDKPLSSAPQLKLWIYNKPRGVITSHKDPQNRPTVFASLPARMMRVVSVGRLDLDSEGLLLLTNSGELARFFELPKSEMVRKYRVRVFGKIDMKALKGLEKGCVINNIRYSGIEVNRVNSTSSSANSWIEITLYEGKNREIRKVLGHFGLQVSRLIRVQYGPYLLGELPRGAVKEIKISKEVYENYQRKS